MALVDNAWYVNFGNGSSTGYYAVTQWAALTTRSAGALVRQLATPAVGSERVFVLVVGNVASGASEPTWITTRGGKTTDATETWQECTGIAAINGDFSANTPKWNNASIKNSAITLGQVITDVAGTIVLICTTAGTAGNGAEPSWNAYTTAGATTADNTVTWTNIGVVGNFTGWQGPHARLANAFAVNWGQAGNVFFVGDNHAETQAATLTLLNPGNAGSPCPVYCVDHTAAVPPGSGSLKTTASISLTGNFAYTISAAYGSFNGIIFSTSPAGNPQPINVATLTNSYNLRFDNCAFRQLSTSAGPIVVGFNAANRSGYITFINTTVQFGAASDGVCIKGGEFNWKNTPTAVVLGTAPTTLFQSASQSSDGQSNILLAGVDLANVTGTIAGGDLTAARIILQDCKLANGVTIATAASIVSNFAQAANVDVVRSDSTGTNYQQQRYRFQGALVPETTIVRTGGATDGTTSISHKITTTAFSQWLTPFEPIPLAIWNNTTGSTVNVTVFGIWGGGAVPNNDDIWIDVEYLGSSATPQASFATTTKANNLATGTACTSDTSTWGGSTTPFKMTVAITPQLKGPIYVTVKAAKVSSTFYVDPQIVLS